MRALALVAALGLLLGAWSSGSPAPQETDSGLRARFDAQIHPDELRDWLKLLAAEPNHVGSPHDRANAEWILARFREWGWDAHIETFDVLYPTPISEMLELVAPQHFEATLQERPIPGDSSATAHDPALPAYVAYQGDGDVTAKLVYVNYGMPDDYKMLERLGVGVKGAIGRDVRCRVCGRRADRELSCDRDGSREVVDCEIGRAGAVVVDLPVVGRVCGAPADAPA